MTVLEMHIALRQGVDRVNSLRNDQLRTEEIDLELNRAQLRFINQRYGRANMYQKGFEESQKRIDDLRVLVKEFTGPAVFKEEIIDGQIWADTFDLPSDYMYLLNQRSIVRYKDCDPISFSLVPLQNVFWFSFSPTQFLGDNGQFIFSLRMTGPNGQSVVAWEPSQDLLNSGFTGTMFPQGLSAVISDMLNNPGQGFNFYMNSYQSISLPGQIIVVVDTQTHPWFNQDLSNGAITPLVRLDQTNNVISQLSPKVTDMSMYSTRIPTGDTSRTQVLNRWSQLDDIYRLLEDPFNSTHYKEPLTVIRGNSIDVYTNAIFLIEGIKITYLRKPLTISLPLAFDSELPEHAHEEIVSMAVSAILEGQTDPRYRTQMAELSMRE